MYNNRLESGIYHNSENARANKKFDRWDVKRHGLRRRSWHLLLLLMMMLFLSSLCNCVFFVRGLIESLRNRDVFQNIISTSYLFIVVCSSFVSMFCFCFFFHWKRQCCQALDRRYDFLKQSPDHWIIVKAPFKTFSYNGSLSFRSFSVFTESFYGLYEDEDILLVTALCLVIL